MKNKLLLTVLCFSVSSLLWAQKKEMETITESDLKAHLEFIASDYMQGRDFSTAVPGVDLAADYLKAQCKLMGLKPGAEDFFQYVEMEMTKPDLANTFLEIRDNNGDVLESFHDNFFSLLGPPDGDTIVSEVVFAGYGWYNDKTKYNDTEGIDVKGKIVLAMSRSVELCTDSVAKSMDFGTEMRKMSKMLMGGAKALILVPDPMNPDSTAFDEVKQYINGGSMAIKGTSVRRQVLPINMILGTKELADQLLKSSGKTLAQLQNEINESGSPKSFELEGIKAKIQLPKTRSEILGKNVIAVVEGSDPVLKNECVVLTAHYDHIGVDANGEVFNGADDNGTGTVALLEIAQAFQSMKKKPKRSIVFAWVTAEEKGLFGSDYYTQHPVFSLEKTLIDINLDMVGRSAEEEPLPDAATEKQLAGPNGLYVVTGKQSTEFWNLSQEISKEQNLVLNDKLSKEFLNRSDYFHFYKNNIPVLGLSTGVHDDYHKVSDEIDKIDYTKMKRITRYAFLVADRVANQKTRIVVDNPVNKN
ncbi:M20/M25/M40 family metallo-hydrolase [Maribellus sp. CM-23]|uniref:M20/M25/M40 family metallo-hydrolase n=1 Tax=Maribellus sp. CM-23 TaxID=2781026 RepID=UPI001F2D0850|nr:M20/M25/M40 family metallo-hydrolase [Maribellus sp. CM-23]MCE4563442.1 M20/M25/M40 family metallo-hydrolase [Maribellus sp. CM-23]